MCGVECGIQPLNSQENVRRLIRDNWLSKKDIRAHCRRVDNQCINRPGA